MPSTDYRTLRVPGWLLEELRRRAGRLEDYLAEHATIEQAREVNLPAEPHEQFGIAPWQIIARLVAKEEAYEERQRRYREAQKKRRAGKREEGSESRESF
ncbi:hypothetical protein [Aeoliella sp.]|uniref:hypothetical protein n=1 Tax=Aeoliella sp. TaxID=2795800 RepID=UPI003CCC1EE6